MTDSSITDDNVKSPNTFTLSSWARRVLARLIDYAISLGFFLAFWLLASLTGNEFLRLEDELTEAGDTVPRLATGGFYTAAFLFITVWAAYQVYLVGSKGQTVGKAVIGIKLVRESDAEVVGVPLAFARAILKFIVALIFPLWIVNYLFPLFDKKRQTVVDKLLKMVVIDVKA